MTAAEAREITDKSLPSIKENVYNHLIDELKKIASSGLYKATAYQSVSYGEYVTYIQHKLKDNGYRIRTYTDNDKLIDEISW